MSLRSLHPAAASLLLACGLLAGCASRSVDVQQLASSPAEFAGWSCDRIEDEADRVQQRAAELAYAVDERAGNNLIALGVGAVMFWPALLAMRTDGPDAEELARLRGRYTALLAVSQAQACPPPTETLPDARAARFPLLLGERLVYEDRRSPRDPAAEWVLRLTALRRGDTEYRSEPARPPDRSAAVPEGTWKQDHAGNITLAPDGALQWPHLLRNGLELGGITAGEIFVTGDPQARARLRGQVVAVGPQTVAGRHFDVAVIELFGDALRGDAATRLDGVIVVDRRSGVLLRLDLRCGLSEFSLQRRLVRVVAPAG
jgi:hypothetical protein